VFHPLEKEHIFEIIDIMSEDLFERAEELGLDVEFDEHAKEFLTDKGFDPKYGARPLRRALQKYVEDPMAEDILNNEIHEGDTIRITHEGEEDELAFAVEHAEVAEEGTPSDGEVDSSEEATTATEEED